MARGAVKVVSINGALTVTFMAASGATPTVFSDEACTSTTSLPATIADGANTTFYFASPGSYTLSVKTASGIQIAGDLNTTKVVTVAAGDVGVYAYDTRLVSRDASGDSGRHSPGTDLAATYVNLGKWKFDPQTYGAVFDGVTDNNTAITACMADARAYGQKAAVVFPKGLCHSSGTLALDTPKIDVEGPGAIDFKIVVGTTTHQTFASAVRGIRWEAPSLVAGTIGVQLQSIEQFDVTDCHFTNVDQAVAVVPFTAASGENQHMSRLRIEKNRMWNVNSALYTRNDASWQWLAFADVDFRDNIIYSLVNGIDVDSCDGLKIKGNRFFKISYPSQDTTKENNIKVGKTDWLSIEDNDLFEAGFEAILLTAEAKDFVIANNRIAWCGQRKPADAIKMTVTSTNYASGVIHGNHADDFTNNFVTITGAGNAGRVKIGLNSFHISAATPASYYGNLVGGGTVPATRFRYLSDTTLSSQVDTNDAGAVPGTTSISTDSINNQQFTSRRKIGAITEMDCREVVRTVTAATDIITFASLNGASGNAYGGLVHVTAEASADATKHASYLLHVGTGGSGAGRGITVVSSLGVITGATTSDPSFTWTVGSADTLKATPIGSTSGSFTFRVTMIGYGRPT